ncbi:cytochrome P450 [Romeria aff. gracilis LEGE 07310]|uniref:Cytochrome P450 n=1 Tax=Vasconcelosia minhoensis LEGE 07310 TaxID=915328 RepID=A0A8J7A4Z3_9CYAN|nr:cytochrome P450 [Romeria gracilis]MBE9076015.1 cytochrome P450 [Romeria aff. gracilis LEGE 07310]
MTSLPLPPGQLGLPLIGETPSFLLDPRFAAKRQRRYGNFFKTHILGSPTVVFIGPEGCEFLLSSHMQHFAWKGGWPQNFQELLGESLFLQDGETHRRNRRLMMPAFHGKALEGYFSTMMNLAEQYQQDWAQQDELTVFPAMKQFTFEVASVLLVGSPPGAPIDQLSQWFTDLTNGLFAPPLRWRWLPYGRALRARDRLLTYIEEMIQTRQANPTQDVLGLLLQTEDEAGNRLSQEEIKVQTLLMLFAGHETTTSLLTSLMMMLGQHPAVLQQAREEQDALAATGTLTLDQLKQMPYLDQVLKETERLYPPVGGGFRQVIKPFEFKGYRVPAGWLALYRINETNRAAYAAPDRFDPDRFSPGRAEHRPSDYSLVSFGGGPRVCLGLAFAKMEMKIFAALLLRRYTWRLAANQDLSMKPIPTLRPASGLKLSLARR